MSRLNEVNLSEYGHGDVHFVIKCILLRMDACLIVSDSGVGFCEGVGFHSKKCCVIEITFDYGYMSSHINN